MKRIFLRVYFAIVTYYLINQGQDLGQEGAYSDYNILDYG